MVSHGKTTSVNTNSMSKNLEGNRWGETIECFAFLLISCASYGVLSLLCGFHLMSYGLPFDLLWISLDGQKVFIDSPWISFDLELISCDSCGFPRVSQNESAHLGAFHTRFIPVSYPFHTPFLSAPALGPPGFARISLVLACFFVFAWSSFDFVRVSSGCVWISFGFAWVSLVFA